MLDPRRGLSIAVLVLALGGLSACAPQRAIEAGLILADIAAAGEPSLFTSLTEPPSRAPVSYVVGGRERAGELYLPAEDSPRAGLVLVPGAAREGKDDPRLVALAETLARARFAVLVPDMAGFRALEVGQRDAREIADALRFLVSDPVLAPGGRVGIAAISYAVGPALLAALEPDLRARVRFIVSVGGFYDLTRVITFFTTGYYRDEDGAWRYREPNAYGKWLFVLSNAERLTDAGERARFREMARRRIADDEASIGDLVQGLGWEGRALLALLENADPERVPDLIAALPQALRDEIEALDPARRGLGDLEARLILIHGRSDSIIPYSESVALARAAPPGRARLYLVEGLDHVEAPAGLAWSLWRAVYRLLEERDGVV